jgi:Ion channel
MVMLQRHPKCLGGLGALRSGELPEIPRLLPVLGYFSMTTLSTLGFGDITPLAMPPVAEGITGQFYMAISGRSAGRLAHESFRRTTGSMKAAVQQRTEQPFTKNTP